MADFMKMVENCRFYNSTDTIYFKLANRLQGFVEEYFRNYTLGRESLCSDLCQCTVF